MFGKAAMDDAPLIFPVDRLDLKFEPKPWPFAAERRAEIDAFFAALQRDNPGIWNGRVLLMHRQRLDGGVFHGAYLETDYASFAAWHRWGYPPAGAHDCFGAGAVLSRDGAFLLGVMSQGTLNAGQIYFPCGTPDTSDIAGGKVDLDYSVRREIEEETGLSPAEFAADPGWITVVDGSLIAQIKVFRASQTADELRSRMMSHLARQTPPELAGIRIVRGPDDADPQMRRFVRAFLADWWRKA